MDTILVIDDEKGITSLIREALSMFGYDVEIALDGQEGIKKFETSAYDLVITDICMPGLDGNSVARHIRNSDRKSTPIIGMSGTPPLSACPVRPGCWTRAILIWSYQSRSP
jgi:DNA-binding response OmpR family regulator